MYAVIEDRGRQYKAQSGDKLVLDRADAEVGATLEVPVMLFVDGDQVEVGAPTVSGKKAVSEGPCSQPWQKRHRWLFSVVVRTAVVASASVPNHR